MKVGDWVRVKPLKSSWRYASGMIARVVEVENDHFSRRWSTGLFLDIKAPDDWEEIEPEDDHTYFYLDEVEVLNGIERAVLRLK